MSAPSRRGPEPLLPLDAAVAFWRWLRRMRTALYLLGVLAAAVLAGTIVPQRPNVPETVTGWLAGTEGPGVTVARVLDALGLYDVFGAPWFIVLVALLFTSLTACLIPRYRAYWRLWRRGRPPVSRNLDAHRVVTRFASDASATEAREAARDVLRRRRFRLRADRTTPDDGGDVALRADPRGVVVPAPADGVASNSADATVSGPEGAARTQVAAEKGHLAREGGSLLFHTAFYFLLIGIVLGELMSFVGQVGVVEGESVADAYVAYWTRDAGRWWGADDHTGMTLTLDRFDVDWTEDGQPVGFRSHVTVDPSGDDREPYEATTFVNVPLVVDGMKIHQLDWGYAARVVVRDGNGEPVWDDWVAMNATNANVWRGAVKAPGADPQLGLEVNLIPRAVERDGRLQITGWPGADAPLLVFTAWTGDLRLDRVQNVNELDTTAMRELTNGALRPGQQTALPTGATVQFVELRQWVGFQMSRRPTVPLLLFAATLLLVGLLPALYAYRRRIWVEASTTPEGRTLVTVAGHAFQRSETFENEHRELVEDLRRRLRSGEPAKHADDDKRDVTEAARS